MTIIHFIKRVISSGTKMNNSIWFSLKIRNILRNVKKYTKMWEPTRAEKKLHKALWIGFNNRISYSWLKVYGTVSGNKTINYIPEYIYYSEIEPRLNYKPYSKALTDKSQYHKFLNTKILPGILIRNICGVYYDSSYNHLPKTQIPVLLNTYLNKKLVIKPTSDTGGGQGVRIFEITKDKVCITPFLTKVTDIESLLTYYKRDFIIQEYVEQHDFFACLNKSSLNTVRICTYRSVIDEQIHVLHRILRVGRTGSVVDNQSAGGFAMSIQDNNNPFPFCVDKMGNRYYSINGQEIIRIGEIPYLKSISVLAKEVAANYLYSRFLGLDFCVDNCGNILLVEVNDSNNEINFYQMTDGPLFGNFTNEIIDYCLNEPKSFVIDFNL